jgi:hypothetical protein
MIFSCRGALVALTTLGSLALGCHVFDPKLYTQGDGGSDLGSSSGVGGDSANDGGAGSLCGRPNPSSLCPSQYAFCDGFEDEDGQNFYRWTSSLVDNYEGSPANAGTAVSVSDAEVCLGQHAFHARTVGGQQQAFLFRVLDNPPNPLHVRFYFYLTQSSLPFELLGFHASGGQFSMLNLDPSTSTFNFSTNFSTAAAVLGGVPVPYNRWLCLELAMRFDANNGEVQLLLDGKQLGDVTGVNTQPSGVTLDTVNVGIIATSPQDTGVNEVYVDEVAVSGATIGCL